MTRIHVEVFGEGRPLVMLHGWAMHTGVWRDFAAQLARHCQVICVDLPGHGRSDSLMSFTLIQVARVILDAIPVPEFTLLGWSMGATVAMEMAEQAPDRIKKLIVLAGNPHFLQADSWPGMQAKTLAGFAESLTRDVRLTLARFLALQVNGLAHGKQFLQTLKLATQECPPPAVEILQAGLDILKDSDMRGSISRSYLPISMILGERDMLVPSSVAANVLQLNPHVDVTVVGNAGHAPFLSHPDQLIRMLSGMI